MIASLVGGVISKAMVYVVTGLLSALLASLLALGGWCWWLTSERDAAREARDRAETEKRTATINLRACTQANGQWTTTVDRVQAALHACTRERDEARTAGRESVARATDKAATLQRQLAVWRAQAQAAEALPQCRRVLDLELCPELADY